MFRPEEKYGITGGKFQRALPGTETWANNYFSEQTTTFVGSSHALKFSNRTTAFGSKRPKIFSFEPNSKNLVSAAETHVLPDESNALDFFFGMETLLSGVDPAESTDGVQFN